MEANNQNSGNGNEPNEIPEKSQSENEDTGYTPEVEHDLETEGNDTNFSEGIDVTPPTQHEFPSVGHPETAFENRPHGRSTGRMVGHEPGTEGI